MTDIRSGIQLTASEARDPKAQLVAGGIGAPRRVSIADIPFVADTGDTLPDAAARAPGEAFVLESDDGPSLRIRGATATWLAPQGAPLRTVSASLLTGAIFNSGRTPVRYRSGATLAGAQGALLEFQFPVNPGDSRQTNRFNLPFRNTPNYFLGTAFELNLETAHPDRLFMGALGVERFGPEIDWLMKIEDEQVTPFVMGTGATQTVLYIRTLRRIDYRR